MPSRRTAVRMSSLPTEISRHKPRRTYASRLVALGNDPASTMAQLGHSDPAFTLCVYTHVTRREPAERDQLRLVVEGCYPGLDWTLSGTLRPDRSDPSPDRRDLNAEARCKTAGVDQSGRTVRVGFLMRFFGGLRSRCGRRSKAVPSSRRLQRDWDHGLRSLRSPERRPQPVLSVAAIKCYASPRSRVQRPARGVPRLISESSRPFPGPTP